LLIWTQVVNQFRIFKNLIWLNPQRNLILIITSGLILSPITYIAAKEVVNKIYTGINKKNAVLVNEKAIEQTENSLPAISSDIATDTTNNQQTPGTSNKTSNTSSRSSSNGSGSSSSSSGSSSGSSGVDNGSSSSLPSCESNYSFFTTSPLNESDYTSITPLGNLNPSGHVFPTDHIYFYLTNYLSSYNLYSPGDATVIQISASEHVTDGFTDYTFTFQPCNEFKAQFGHVSALADKLSQALSAPYQWDSTYSTGGKTYRNYGKNVSLTITAGEQIGTVGGNAGQMALDMNAYDSRITLNFANLSRWSQRSDTTHTVCPINYYSSDLKTTLTNRFGDYDGNPKRTVDPICGTIEQDVAGTTQGNWFVAGTTTFSSEDPHLALVHDNIDPAQAVFSVGTSMSASGLSSGTYQFSPQSSGLVNRDFDDITSDGNAYCFEPNYLSGKIIMQLTNSVTLKIEKQADSCGSGPWNFTSAATDFER